MNEYTDAYEDVIKIAWNLKEEAVARRFHPKAFLMGRLLFFSLRAFQRRAGVIIINRDDHWNDTLFGLPIKLDEHNKWEISVEVEEFTEDLGWMAKNETSL